MSTLKRVMLVVALGKGLGNVGTAVKEIGIGTGTLVAGIGQDMQDASSKQMDNRNNRAVASNANNNQ